MVENVPARTPNALTRTSKLWYLQHRTLYLYIYIFGRRISRVLGSVGGGPACLFRPSFGVLRHPARRRASSTWHRASSRPLRFLTKSSVDCLFTTVSSG